MFLLATNITHGQAVTLLLLCIFLFVFILVDVCLLFYLRRGNRRLEKDKSERAEAEEKTEKK